MSKNRNAGFAPPLVVECRTEGGQAAGNPWTQAVPLNRRKAGAGFTLVELLLVVVIIGILAAIVIPKLTGRSEEARVEAARMQISSFMTGLDLFEQAIGRFPTTAEWDANPNPLLAAPANLPDPAKWKGPYLRAQVLPADPWGFPYLYSFPSATDPKDYDLISVGPDGQPGTEDDVLRP